MITKRLFVFVFALCSGALFGQSRWSLPIVFAEKTSAPDLAIDPGNGDLHIVTIGNYDYRSSGLTYTRTDSVGNILTQEIVPGTEAVTGGWNFGPSVAVDPQGAPHVCYALPTTQTAFKLLYINKTDGHWAHALQLAGGLERGYMVRIAIDGSGRGHVGRGYATETPWGKAAYGRVVNNSLNQQIDKLDSYRVDDRLEIDTSPDGAVHLVMGCPNATNSPVTYFRSVDGGATLNRIADIHSNQCTGRNGSPDVFADASGIVHICYGSQIDQDAGGKPSIRYVRYQNGRQIRNVLVTRPDALETYLDGNGWGLGSVAATDDGRTVGIAYLVKGGGDLYFTFSSDSGATWSAPELLAGSVGRGDGRDKPVLRAHRNHFYLVYPSGQDMALRMYRNIGDNAPTADAGGPYAGTEGGTIAFNGSNSSDSGQNPGIVQYQWDFDNDGTWDVTTAVPTTQHAYPGVYNGQVRLRVLDRAQLTGEDTALVRMANVPPTVDLGSDRTGGEGLTLHFQAGISDPGQDVNLIQWNFGDGSAGQGTAQDHVYNNTGRYKVKVTATDTNGGSGSDSIFVTVINEPPIAQANGPYGGQAGTTIRFTGSGSDSGPPGILAYAWDLDNNGSFEAVEQNPSKTFFDEGKFTVWLRVTDHDGASGLDSATVTIMEDRVTITGLTDRTTQEGSPFTPIPLSPLVHDPFHSAESMTWRVRGGPALGASIAGGILSVHPLDGEWSGSEDLTIAAADPAGNSDSIRVRFIVIAVNDAPEWIRHNPDMTIPEDSSAAIPLDSLRSRVRDVDNPVLDVVFGVRGNVKIQWQVDAAARRLVLRPVHDWYGSETIVFSATDKGGAFDLDTVLVTVPRVIDPPEPFSLIDPLYARYDSWPDTIRFRWRASSTQDSIGVVYYAWNLRDQAGMVDPLRRGIVTDTAYAFAADVFLDDGVYFWNVEAVDQYGLRRESGNMGILDIRSSGVESQNRQIPAVSRLDQNYPNPFNPATRITFGLSGPKNVRLAIYNPLGQEVRILLLGLKQAGYHSVEWDGRDGRGNRVPSGVYVYRLEAGDRVFYRKMVLAQ
jgi:PKD repeat protein